MMFLKTLSNKDKLNYKFHKLQSSVKLTRKILRFGQPISLLQRIIDRFVNACYDDKAVVTEQIAKLDKDKEPEFNTNKRL